MAGCSTDAESPMATYPRTSDTSFQAALDGVLEVVDGCLVVTSGHDKAPTTRQFVLFPTPDTSWHSDHIEYRGASFRVGDRVRLGGGLLPSLRLPADAVVPSGCANLGEGFIVGNVSAPSG